MDFLSNLFNKEKLDEMLTNIDGLSNSADEIAVTMNGILQAIEITNILVAILIGSILLNTIVMWKRKSK